MKWESHVATIHKSLTCQLVDLFGLYQCWLRPAIHRSIVPNWISSWCLFCRGGPNRIDPLPQSTWQIFLGKCKSYGKVPWQIFLDKFKSHWEGSFANANHTCTGKDPWQMLKENIWEGSLTDVPWQMQVILGRIPGKCKSHWEGSLANPNIWEGQLANVHIWKGSLVDAHIWEGSLANSNHTGKDLWQIGKDPCQMGRFLDRCSLANSNHIFMHWEGSLVIWEGCVKLLMGVLC